MRTVKVSELKDGDIFIYRGSYYEVIDALPIKRTGLRPSIETKCFMSPTDYRRRGIGSTVWFSIDLEVLLCERGDDI